MKEKGLPFVFLSTLLTLTSCATFDKRNSDPEIQPWLNKQLPSYIVPEHYDIALNLPLEGNSFKGTVKITAALKRPSNLIIVHANDLSISKTEVMSGEESFPVEETFSYEPNQYWIIRLSKEISIGKYVISFEFEGDTSDSSGLSKRSYWNEELQQESFIIASIFKETNARRAFPCFDEPNFRAEFSIRIVHEQSHFPVSSSPVKEIKNTENSLTETTFEKTLPIPTYLVGIFVSDFKYQETVNQRGVKIRIYSPASSLDKVGYTLEASNKLFTYFEEYFGIPYPLPKLDIISIPGFGSVAEGYENWGLILEDESNVIWDKKSSIFDKRQILNSLPYGFVHMWLGGVVALKSWDDTWFKAGLTSYLSNKGVEHTEAMENMESSFVAYYNTPGFLLDGNIHSYPIISSVTATEEDAEFNINAYIIYLFKSGTIIRMLEKFMGEDFRKGLTNFLRKYSLSNAGTEEFYTEMSAASRIGLDIRSIMDTWTKQKNFPYITVEHDEEGNYAVQQHRYLQDPSTALLDKQPSVYNYVWKIPLTFRTAELKENDVIMLNSPEKVSLKLPKSDWVKFNVNVTGCYLVNYELKDWTKFSTLLQTDLNVFDPTDRLSFILDSFSLASAGIVSYEVPLNISLYLKKETEYVPWYIVELTSTLMFQKLRGEIQVTKLLLKHYGCLAKDLFKKYTWEDTGDLTEKTLRRSLIAFTCKAGDEECRGTALVLLKDWMKGVDISRKGESLGEVLRYGAQADPSDETFNYLWQRFLEEQDKNLKGQLLFALTSMENKTLLERLLTLAADENINPGYFLPILKAMTRNHYIGERVACNFTINNWSVLNEKFGASEVEEFGAELFGYINTEKGLKKIENFYNMHPTTESFEKTRKDTLDKIRENINWLHRNKQTILDWLLAHVNTM